MVQLLSARANATRSSRVTAILILSVFVFLTASPLTALEIPGEKVKANTDRVLSSIRWSTNLESLRSRALSEKKLIFWLQLVGNLDGGL